METNYYTNLLSFFKYLKDIKEKNLQLGIGFTIDDIKDTKRSLNFDIILSNYDDNSKIEKKAKKYNKLIIINYDFNNFCNLSKTILNKFCNINKIQSIIFDSSTFKFFKNIKFVGMLYYLCLEINGSIYIESNVSICDGSFITKFAELIKYKNMCEIIDGCFRYQQGIFISNILKKDIINNNFSQIIVSSEDIYKINIEYLQKWFYGATIELLEKGYPIDNYKYPITKYYKITKKEEHKKIIEYIEDNIEIYNLNLSKGTSINLLYHT